MLVPSAGLSSSNQPSTKVTTPELVDSWHKIIFSAIGAVFTAMSAAIAALWRRDMKRSREAKTMHDEYAADVKALAQQAIELARAATYAPPLKRSAPPPPDLKD